MNPINHEAAVARQLPDEFLGTRGTPIERILRTVYHHWGKYPDGEQRQLAQALLVLLEPLLTAPKGAVPEALRLECEQVVREWEVKAKTPPR
ncbi:MAG: hypothetical protein HY560_06420 [Gemmatimonadetes bacterium]|nr:hypothetical protein [Gemmatimonadota bacterium]